MFGTVFKTVRRLLKSLVCSILSYSIRARGGDIMSVMRVTSEAIDAFLKQEGIIPTHTAKEADDLQDQLEKLLKSGCRQDCLPHWGHPSMSR